jgi:hypothetical protein
MTAARSLPLPWHVHRHAATACYDCGTTASVRLGDGKDQFHLCGSCWASLGAPLQVVQTVAGLAGVPSLATTGAPSPGRERGGLGPPPVPDHSPERTT